MVFLSASGTAALAMGDGNFRPMVVRKGLAWRLRLIRLGIRIHAKT